MGTVAAHTNCRESGERPPPEGGSAAETSSQVEPEPFQWAQLQHGPTSVPKQTHREWSPGKGGYYQQQAAAERQRAAARVAGSQHDLSGRGHSKAAAMQRHHITSAHGHGGAGRGRGQDCPLAPKVANRRTETGEQGVIAKSEQREALNAEVKDEGGGTQGAPHPLLRRGEEAAPVAAEASRQTKGPQEPLKSGHGQGGDQAEQTQRDEPSAEAVGEGGGEQAAQQPLLRRGLAADPVAAETTSTCESSDASL